VPFLVADLVRLSILTALHGLALWVSGLLGMLD